MTSKSKPLSVAELNGRLGYSFRDAKLLELSIIHKSFGNEHRAAQSVSVRDNERLEFLGDAILDLIISQYLLETYPNFSEGDLSKLRAGLVNERSLAKVARSLSLGDYVWLGKGEEFTGGRTKDSILASTFEAIVAAVYQDGGFDAANNWVRTLFEDKIASAGIEDVLQDYKTKLQEVVQAKYRSAPRYEVIQSSGPDHDKTFEVQLSINGSVICKAAGKSKKQAEQLAAKEALEREAREVQDAR